MDLDQSIVDLHTQLYNNSCVPMSVEFVLKLLGLVPVRFFELQVEWKRSPYSDFSFFNRKTISGLRFLWPFSPNRGPNFPLDQLFNTIDSELSSGRYVLISLREGPGFHNYLIYDKSKDGEFKAITKLCGGQTKYEENVRRRVKQMEGTDILIYEYA